MGFDFTSEGMKGCSPWAAVLMSCLVLISGSAPAGAQESGPLLAAYREDTVLFQDIPSVFGASKYEQKLTEAPSAVSIITQDEIRQYGYRTLADVLRSVRSFYVTYDRNYSYVGVRGFGPPGDYNSRVLLLVDGHRLNENVYDGAYVGTDGVLDVDLIDRVEVIRGPGSSLYGSNAVFAVVNIITRRGRDVRGAEVAAGRGSFDTTQGRATYGNRLANGTELLVSGSLYDSSGQDLFFPPYGRAVGADHDRAGKAFLKVSAGRVTVSAAYSERTKGIPTAAFGTDFGDPGNRTTDERAYADVGYQGRIGESGELTARLFMDYYHYTGQYKYAGVTNRDTGFGRWWGGDARFVTTGWEGHRVIGGLELKANIAQEQKNEDLFPYAVWADSKQRSLESAAYVQDEISLAAGLLLNAGVRYDHYAAFGGTTNPRLALIYSVDEKNTLKLLYGSAFRAPNAFELYYESISNQPNPGLGPETVTTLELVFETQAAGVHATVSGYYYTMRGLISQSEAVPGVTIYRNIDRVTARGGEAGVGKRWQNGIDARISMTVQRAENEQTGEPIVNSPSLLGKLNLLVPLSGEKLAAGIEGQFMSRRKTAAGAYTAAYAVTNLTLSGQQVLPNLGLSVSVYNLFDRAYADPASSDLDPIDAIEQDGRSYRVLCTYLF